MSTETKQVLDMLAEGKITTEDAERLLERLGSARPGAGQGSGRAAPDGVGTAERSAPGGKLKYLRVVVSGSEGDQVNIRVPLQLVRTGIKLGAMLPEQARQRLQEKGIDLSQITSMDSEEMVEALRELTVDVDSNKGDVVRIFCE
jgi:hypothetical protein